MVNLTSPSASLTVGLVTYKLVVLSSLLLVLAKRELETSVILFDSSILTTLLFADDT